MATLFKGDHDKVMAQYDQWMADAKKPAPVELTKEQLSKLSQKGRVEALAEQREKKAAYDENPGTKLRLAAVAKTKEKYGSEPGDPAFEADFKLALEEQKKAFEDGLTMGKPGNFTAAFDLFKQGNIMAGIKEALKAIPLFGDLLIVPGKMLMALFSGNPIGPVTAYKQALHERALGAAFPAAGVAAPDEVIKNLSASMMLPYTAPAIPASASPDAVTNKVYKSDAPEVTAMMKAMQENPEFKPLITAGSSVILTRDTSSNEVIVLGHMEGKDFVVDAAIKENVDKKPMVMKGKDKKTLLKGAKLTLNGDGVVTRGLDQDLISRDVSAKGIIQDPPATPKTIPQRIDDTRIELLGASDTFARKVLGKSGDDLAKFNKANITVKIVAGPPQKKLESMQNRVRELNDLMGEGITLRQNFEDLHRMDAAIGGDSTKLLMKWHEFVDENKLDDVATLSVDRLKELNARVESDLAAKKTAPPAPVVTVPDQDRMYANSANEMKATVAKLQNQPELSALLIANGSVMLTKDSVGNEVIVLGRKTGNTVAIGAMVKEVGGTLVELKDEQIKNIPPLKLDANGAVGDLASVKSMASQAFDATGKLEVNPPRPTVAEEPPVEPASKPASKPAFSGMVPDAISTDTGLKGLNELLDIGDAPEAAKKMMSNIVKAFAMDGDMEADFESKTDGKLSALIRLSDDSFAVVSGKEENGVLKPEWVTTLNEEGVVEMAKAGPGTPSIAILTNARSAPAVEMTKELETAARDYAVVRFINFNTGVVDSKKVDSFVKKYTSMVTSSGMDAEAQRARAGEITGRTNDIKAEIKKAGADAFASMKANPLSLLLESDQWKPMKQDIKAALELMKKTDNDTVMKPGARTENLTELLKDLPVVEVEGPPGKSQVTPAGVMLAAARSTSPAK